MKTETKAKQEVPAQSTEVAKTQPSSMGLQNFDIGGESLPDLDQAQELPINLSSEYWTPEKEGESKRVFYSHIEDREIVDDETGNISMLPTAFFLEKKDGAISTVCNSSKRLVGAFQNNSIARGTPFIIIYNGKKKNKNNPYMSDRWTIKPLVVKI